MEEGEEGGNGTIIKDDNPDLPPFCPKVTDNPNNTFSNNTPADRKRNEARKRSITTGTVLDKPHEARTRAMLSFTSYDGAWLHQQFKLMNWNILADQYCTESMYPYAENWCLSWDYRKNLIAQELKSIAADIITLQEVEECKNENMIFKAL